MIEFSRHAKRRMKLYGISEDDVLAVIDKGKKEILARDQVAFVHDLTGKFRYPIKVIGLCKEGATLIITTYPLKKRRAEK